MLNIFRSLRSFNLYLYLYFIEVLFAVGKLTGTINPFMENEESFSKALDKIVIITNEGEEIKRSKFAAVVARFVPLLIEKLSNLGFEIIYSNEEVNCHTIII